MYYSRLAAAKVVSCIFLFHPKDGNSGLIGGNCPSSVASLYSKREHHTTTGRGPGAAAERTSELTRLSPFRAFHVSAGRLACLQPGSLLSAAI